jgi:hypothetical protein
MRLSPMGLSPRQRFNRDSVKIGMMRKILILRAVLTCAYGILAFVFCHLIFSDSFCDHPGSQGFLLAIMKVTVAVTLWGSIANASCGIVTAPSKRFDFSPSLAAALSAVFVGLGVGYLPNLIFTGYGVFRFDGSWASVTCLFEEQQDFFFRFFAPFVLGFLTLAREILGQRLQDRWA